MSAMASLPAETRSAGRTVASSTAMIGGSTSHRSALEFNLPKEDNFFVNSRGQRLHLRTFLPNNSSEIRAIMFWYHGYASHVNGPTLVKVATGLAENGFAVIAVDQHGHGYSDGEQVLITDYNHLVDDNMGILDTVTTGTQDGEGHNFGMDETVRQTLTTVPFFLGGQSLGGGLALLLGLHLRKDEQRANIAKRFVGVMANCPAIKGNYPPRPVLMLLKYVIAPLFPKAQIPSFMEKVSVPELVWTRQEHMEMGLLDKVGKPGGLGWPGTMRVGTGAQLLDMIGSLESRLNQVDFPFLVLHDPNDGIVKFEGTQKLLKEASTPDDIVRGKEVKEMLNMKHDLLSNASNIMLAAYIDWAASRLEHSN